MWSTKHKNNSKNKSVCRCFFPQSGNQNKCNGHKQRSKNTAWHLYTLPYVVCLHQCIQPTQRRCGGKAKAPTTIQAMICVLFFASAAGRREGREGFAVCLRRSGNRRRGREAGSASAVYEFKVGLHATTVCKSHAISNGWSSCWMDVT